MVNSETIFLTITFLAGVTVGQDLCTISVIETNVIQCFIDEGINVPTLFDLYRSTDQLDVLLEDIFVYVDINQLCGPLKANLQRAMQCTQQEINDCSSGPDLISPSSLPGIVETMCQHRNDINFQCIRDKTTDLSSCGAEKALARRSPSMSTPEIFCLAAAINIECLKTELKSCGCATAKVYSDIGLDNLTPAYCDSDSENRNRVICSTSNPNAFEYDGLGGGVAGLRETMLVTVLAVITARLIALSI